MTRIRTLEFKVELALVFVQWIPFAAILAPCLKSCEGCDYGNKPIDLPFQSRNVVEFHLPLLLVPFALRNLVTFYSYICTMLVNSVLVYDCC